MLTKTKYKIEEKEMPLMFTMQIVLRPIASYTLWCVPTMLKSVRTFNISDKIG